MGELRVAVVTCSDSCHAGKSPDEAGRALIDECASRGWDVSVYDVVPCDLEAIAASIVEAVDVGAVQVVLTSGGIGLSSADVTPEATLLAADREVPGIAEALRAEGLRHSPGAMLTRGVAGLRGQALVVNLPAEAADLRPLLPIVFEQLEYAAKAAGGAS